jgi:hypothetical protein
MSLNVSLGFRFGFHLHYLWCFIYNLFGVNVWFLSGSFGVSCKFFFQDFFSDSDFFRVSLDFA